MTHTVQTPKSVPSFNLTLRGHDLWSKMGFGDGDCLQEFIWHDPELEAFDSLMYSSHNCTQFDSLAISALVELLLLPRFDRPVTIRHASFSHNAIRANEDEWWDPNAWPEHPLPEVEVEAQTVMDVLYSMQRVFTAFLNKEPVAFPSCLKQTALIFTEVMSYPTEVTDAGSDAEFRLPHCSSRRIGS